jgi:cellobiose-specific phosphotransferase system component IIA
MVEIQSRKTIEEIHQWQSKILLILLSILEREAQIKTVLGHEETMMPLSSTIRNLLKTIIDGFTKLTEIMRMGITKFTRRLTENRHME